MQRRISKTVVDRLKPGQFVTDSNPVGFVARRLPSGAVTYGFRYRDRRSGRQHWIGLGVHGEVTAEQARTKALQLAKDVRGQKRPISARQEAAHRRATERGTLDSVLNVFVDRHVRPNLRSAFEIERVFNRYVRPRLGDRPIYDLRRRDIVALIDTVEDDNGPVMADRVLAHLRKALNWQASRDDQFNSPVVKGMARTKPKERARSRVLDDQEIRDLWQALDTLDGEVPACFPAFAKTLLLTAQRRGAVSTMAWDEIDGRDWVIPATSDKSKTEQTVPLTDAVISLLGEKGRGYVFTSDGGKSPFSGFSKSKQALEHKLAAIRKAAGRKLMEHWTLHDLRRTARSLMSRAGVSSDHAERVLGHVIPGVRGTYDRHQYRAEKLDALEKLAALVERILRPGEKIVGFPKGRQARTLAADFRAV